MSDKHLIEIERSISMGNDILDIMQYMDMDRPKYSSWVAGILAYMQNHFSDNSKRYVEEINEAKNQTKAYRIYERWLYEHAKVTHGILCGFKEGVESGAVIPISQALSICAESHLYLIFDKFHDVVRQLRMRREDRETLSVDDEYDVQDLLHALLKMYFDDIRTEESTPSVAGASSRIDFLLKKEQIGIEVKKTRKGLTVQKLRGELIEDIAQYKSHPDCKKLICFVYDPEWKLGNPNGIMNDLNLVDEDFAEVIIRPL